jgi:hypothetical protein
MLKKIFNRILAFELYAGEQNEDIFIYFLFFELFISSQNYVRFYNLICCDSV